MSFFLVLPTRKDLVRVEATVIEKTESWPRVNMKFKKRKNYKKKKSKLEAAEPALWSLPALGVTLCPAAGQWDQRSVLWVPHHTRAQWVTHGVLRETWTGTAIAASFVLENTRSSSRVHPRDRQGSGEVLCP